GAQDLADLGDQEVDVVADPALAELAEAGEVAADLGGVDVRVLADLLRRDRVAPLLLGLGQDLQVSGQSGGDADGQSMRGQTELLRKRSLWGRLVTVTSSVPTRSKTPLRLQRVRFQRPVCDAASTRRRSSAGSTRYLNALRPSTSTTGICSR